MNHSKKPSIRTAASFAMTIALAAFGSTGAHATALSNVSITSFTITASAGTLSLLADQNYRTFDAQATSGGGLVAFDESSWSGSASSSVSGAAITTTSLAAYSSLSDATTAVMSLSATALPTSAPNASVALPNASYSIGTQSGAFTLSQAGIVTLTIGYTANLATTFAGATESAFAMAGIDIGNYGTGLDQAQGISYASSSLATGSGSFSGLLTVQIAMGGASDLGFYTLDGRADVSSISAVPELETWALFPAGLLLVAVLAYRRRESITPDAG